jgi:hypothetical protein
MTEAYYALAGIGGALAGAGVMYWYLRRSGGLGLLAAVKNLKKVLFAAYGTQVGVHFNAVWRAAGLKETGIVDITDGKT